ncbi:MAG: ECF transporter S component [Calditrichaeota bacterium]|nr:ECF transporter S component [Calditrichota bacterium]
MQSKTKNLILIALFLALCVVVPIVFHSMGVGAIFLPMFLPILLAGFIIEFPYAILVGLLGPFLSSILTGMPPLFPTTPIMTVEGVTAAGLASYLYQRQKWPVWSSLIVSIVAERLSLIAMGFVIAPLLNLPGEIFSFYKIVESTPGILLQLAGVPIILKLLWQRKLTSR